jgi:hypothetical protein
MKNALVKLAAIWGVWTALAILLASASALYRINVGQPAQLAHNLRIVLLNYWIWAVLTPIVFYLAKRFRFCRDSWARAIALHFCFYLLLTLAHGLIAQAIRIPAGAPDSYHGSLFRFRVVSSLYDSLWMYWPVVVIWSLFEYYQRYREQSMRAAQLKEQLVRAELQALRSQLHPHFLFNTLNSIASLMHEDVNAADDMLADLSLLLRACFKSQDEQEVPLRQEIALVETYISIQQRRFEGRLRWLRDVPPELLDAAIPTLLLQPLVENSILHAIAPRSAPGQIKLCVRRNGSMMELELVDNGMGLAMDHKEGVGLSNTRSRLRQLYEDRHSFEIAGREDGGVLVKIAIPLRLLPAQTGGFLDDDTHCDCGRRSAGPPADSVAAPTR